MKHITTVILLINGLLLSSAVQGQNRQNQQNGSENRRFGAPNSLRNQSQSQGQQNRQTARKPLGNANQGRQQGQGGSARKPQQGGGNKPQTGMTHGQKPGQQKPKPKPNLREVLGLTEEQVKALRAARKDWHILAKSIRDNKELSDEEKRAQFKENHKEFDAKVRKILTEEQYSKLREIHRQNARPNNNGNEQNGHSRAEHRRELRQILDLTEEQLSKLRAAHHYATKKIKAIIANEELTREEKKEQIKEVKKQFRNRCMEILTEEQKEKLRQWRAHHRTQHQQQGGNQEQGRPQRRPQQGGNQEQGRPQRRPQTQNR